MQYLWIGSIDSDDEFVNKAKKGMNSASAQVSQFNLINGIESVDKISIDSINGSIVPEYPKYSDLFVKDYYWSHNGQSIDYNVGYLNLKYFNRMNCQKNILKATKKWLKNNYKGQGLTVFTYSMRSVSMKSAVYIKKHISNSKIFLIVSDLPQYMDLSENKLKKILKKFNWIYIKSLQKYFDGFILYSEMMAKFLNIESKKWLLMEGSYNLTENNYKSNIDKNFISFMYSGSLDKKYGIYDLVNSFMNLHKDGCNLELWITGGGSAENYIKECSLKDSRIKFYGFLENREDVLKKENNATFLINMRLPCEDASNYCFPSKLFEYMVSRTPVLTYKIGGIPSEYYKYLIIINNEDVLYETMQKVINDDYNKFIKIGNNARCFILKNKTKEKQAEKIIKFIDNIGD